MSTFERARFKTNDGVTVAALANDFAAFKEVVFAPIFLDTIITQMNANEDVFK